MKNYISIIVIIAFFSSCSNELDLKAPSELGATGFWETEEAARITHPGMYVNLRDEANDFWLLGEIRSDVWGGRTYESASNENLIESNITVSTAPFGGWAGLYSNIHRVNDFLSNVPNISFVNESDKSHMIGQAYGLRALYYYTLLKTWGDVPIVTEPFSTESLGELSKPRSPQADVMDLIKSDLAASLSSFGSNDSFWEGSRVYWSKAATLALKGDVYIWSGNLMNGGNADFTEAKTALLQIASFGVSLEPNISSLWGVENEDNNEFIFALSYAQDQASNIYNSFTGRSTEIHSNYNDKGVFMGPVGGINFIINGANRYGQSEKTLLLLDDNDDARKDATFIRLYTNDNNGSGYPVYNEPNYYGSIFNKFLGEVDGSQRIFENDVPVYRYADVILLLAEAKNLLTEDPSGEINQIRKRAYGTNYVPSTHDYVNSSETANANAILNERYKEFIGEGKRWWDLRRAGNSFVFDNVDYLSPGDEYKLVLPITNDMIGRNPLLEQTAGYPN
ncbi:RagB/SusD family nutrient uptake outer membrane protein [Gelidibacter pelagius]|uniref:RagB/SusD family nutrient uptake outer membrane protein n=1 Tax=Gelidibacter pelagius TaxID=2819985 RepID=A0ABS3SSU4_9FLAO|nr:RagB/SusD family nutrient uptake outer membrane protein [Gelidibacter pelagius]MBO3098772.1 RagB/SusD family nutrient uptake outer membrane protein [Gelidibacter pelagius]